MLFLLSNLWLPYVISLVLMVVVILIVDHGGIIAVVSVFFAVSDCAKAFPEQNFQVFLISACISGMLDVIFVLWFLLELGEGMSG